MMGSNFGFLRRSVKRAVAAKRDRASHLVFFAFRVFAFLRFAFLRYALTRFRAFVHRANSGDGRPVSQRARVPNASDPEPGEAERPG